MATPEEALATQLRNIVARIGRDLPTVRSEIAGSGKVKHGEIRSWLMVTYGLGYGDANSLAHFANGSKGAAAGPDGEGDPLDGIYSNKKQHLRVIHDAVVEAIRPWGEYEIAPKKGYVSLRRGKQFATLGPKSSTRSELGINLKDDISSDRIVAQKPGGMCQYAVSLHSVDEVDGDVLKVLKRAFDAAC